MRTKGFRTSSVFALLIVLLVFNSCAKTRAVQTVAEEPPAPPPTAAVALAAQPVATSKLPAPTLEQVQATVTRILQDSVTIDSSHNPSFFVGDFNGDQSEDLAVILRPVSAKLSFLNQEFPRWIAREPLKQVLLPKSRVVANPSVVRGEESPASGQTIRFAANDVLLAIVHGFGEKGWRDPEATQTHVLRDVVANDIRTLPFASVAKEYKGVKPFPSIYGDLIQETLIGQTGFLHFAGGMYEWYDPRNYKPVLGPVHARMSGRR